MGNFVQLLIGTTLVLVFVSLINVNSSPIDDKPVVIASGVIVDLEIRNNSVKCQTDADCGNGKCSNSTGCVCERGWTTYGNVAKKIEDCKYNQRSKKTAFFLSLFVGTFGVDWFYLSRSNLAYIFAGILKLLLGCACCGAWPLSYFGPEIQNSESIKAKLRGVNTCVSLLAFAWWIVDWARILGDRFPDGNAASLISW